MGRYGDYAPHTVEYQIYRGEATDRSSSYGEHSHTKIAPLVTKITYIKMDPRRYIRNGFVNPSPMDSHFYAVCKSRHESSMIPKALKFATLQKKMAPIPPHT